MSTARPHTKLITAAARALLRPMGIVQKGRSRTWYDDQGWWAGLIEFQPSSWSRGSYLNVGVQWLWDTRWKSLSAFMYGGENGRDTRLQLQAGGQFIEYESDVQFGPLAWGMVEEAAERATYFRSLLSSVESAAAVLGADEDLGLDLDAGIVLALAGDAAGSRRRFGSYLAWDASTAASDLAPRPAWQQEQADRVRTLLGLADDLAAFRQRVADDIAAVRAAIGLPPQEPPWAAAPLVMTITMGPWSRSRTFAPRARGDLFPAPPGSTGTPPTDPQRCGSDVPRCAHPPPRGAFGQWGLVAGHLLPRHAQMLCGEGLVGSYGAGAWRLSPTCCRPADRAIRRASPQSREHARRA